MVGEATPVQPSAATPRGTLDAHQRDEWVEINQRICGVLRGRIIHIMGQDPGGGGQQRQRLQPCPTTPASLESLLSRPLMLRHPDGGIGRACGERPLSRSWLVLHPRGLTSQPNIVSLESQDALSGRWSNTQTHHSPDA